MCVQFHTFLVQTGGREGNGYSFGSDIFFISRTILIYLSILVAMEPGFGEQIYFRQVVILSLVTCP